jgi:hypothetical protein
MAKNIMKEIGDTMEKIFYRKKAPKPAEKEIEEEAPQQVETEGERASPWLKATDLDAKMKKRMKEAGL